MTKIAVDRGNAGAEEEVLQLPDWLRCVAE